MISTTGEYALRAAVCLAMSYPEPQTTADIASKTQVPPGYLSKVMQLMVRRELIVSRRGLHGGFTLVRPPAKISVLDVLVAADAGPKRIKKCPLGIKGHIKLCPLHRLVDESVAHAEKSFASTHLAALAESSRGITPLCETTG
ncbi:Rrf2 family transcriptional regulator [soil metagenome]